MAATDLYVHGVRGVSEEGFDFVALTAEVAIDEALTREALADPRAQEAIADSVNDDVILFRLVEVGPLREGLPE